MATPLRALIAPNAAKLDRCRQQHNGSRELSLTEGRAGGGQHHPNYQRTKAATPHHPRHPTYRRQPPPALVHPDERVARQLLRLHDALKDGRRRQKTEPAAGSDHRSKDKRTAGVTLPPPPQPRPPSSSPARLPQQTGRTAIAPQRRGGQKLPGRRCPFANGHAWPKSSAALMRASYIPMSTSVSWRAGTCVASPIVAEATAAPCETAWSAELPGRAPRAEGEPIMADVTAAPGKAARSAVLPGSATGGQVEPVMAGATAAPSEAAGSAELPVSTPGGEVEPGAGGGRGLLS